MWRIRSFWKIQIEPPVPSQRRKRLIEDRIEYRRKITGRGVDNLEHLGGRGLLFQGFAGLVDEPRILHRYDGFGGETFKQRDLFFRERFGGGGLLLQSLARLGDEASVLQRACGICKLSSRTPPNSSRDHG